MKKKKKLLLGLLLVPVIGGWLMWRAGHSALADPAGETKIVNVDRGLVRLVVNATGRISPNYEVDIKCKASGIVIKLPFDISDTVKKGDLVLELDRIDEQRRFDQQEAALLSAQARLSKSRQTLDIAEQTLITDRRQAEVNLHTAEISARDLRAKADRLKQLLDKKLASPEDAESADTSAQRAANEVETMGNTIAALKTREISIEMDRTEVKLAEIGVKTAQTDLDDAQQRLIETKVTAPIDGVVTTRPVQLGSIVASGITNVGGGTSIMTVTDLSRLFVLAAVDEADIGRVKLDQKVVIKCDAFPDKKFEGKILRMAAKGVNQQSVVSFEVKIEVLGEGKELLRPEMTTDIEIVIAEHENVLRVPSEAVLVREKDKSHYVLVPKDTAGTQPATTSSRPATAPSPLAVAASAPSTKPATTTASTPTTAPTTAPAPEKIPTEERNVVIGVDDGTHCEILGGLKEGDKIAIKNDSQGQWTKKKTNNDNSDEF